MEMGEVYRETRLRLTDLVREHAGSASMELPACPGWTIRDVIGHLSGVCVDILAGNIEGVATPPWTAAQVAARKERSLEEILEEWSAAAPQVEEITPMFPRGSAEQWVTDITTHEQDVRGALNKPGARDAASMEVALGFLGKGFIRAAKQAGITGLHVRAGEREWSTDNETKSITFEAQPFEFARALSGRRSLDQIRAMNWDGDPEPYLKAFEWGPFQPAATDIVEP